MNDPAPEPTIVDLTTLLESNRSNCPIANFTLKMADEVEG